MLERKISKDLLNWKNNPNKMCLLIKGARQVGKTFIINKFCLENYKNYIYINFFEMPSYKDIFDGNLDYETILAKTKKNTADEIIAKKLDKELTDKVRTWITKLMLLPLVRY